MARAEWTLTAEDELTEVAYWIAVEDERPLTARTMIEEIPYKAEIYAGTPGIGQRHPDLPEDWQLAVRVPAKPEFAHGLGFDAVAWARRRRHLFLQLGQIGGPIRGAAGCGCAWLQFGRVGRRTRRPAKRDLAGNPD